MLTDMRDYFYQTYISVRLGAAEAKDFRYG